MKKKVIFSIVLIIAGILIVIINKIIGNFNWHLRSDRHGWHFWIVGSGCLVYVVPEVHRWNWHRLLQQRGPRLQKDPGGSH